MKNKLSIHSFIRVIIILAIFVSTFLSCSFFETPQGTCELLSIYTQNEEDSHYIIATLKISNISNMTIYNSTINIQADTNKRTYYKTISQNIMIKPNKTIFIPVELYFIQKSKETTEKEEWYTDSFIISDSSWD